MVSYAFAFPIFATSSDNFQKTLIVATALCNTVISNMAGIFITPALLLQFFGKSIELPFLDLVRKLVNKVLLPVGIGQLLRMTPVKDVYAKYTIFFKRLQEVSCIRHSLW